MKKLGLFIALLFTSNLFSQTLLLEENFDFAGNLTDNGWTSHSGGSTNPISTTTGLLYVDYPSSNIGNAALIIATGQSVHRTFTVQTSGSIYTSFLVNVSATGTEYFINLGNDPIGTTYRGRIYILNDGWVILK